MGTIYRPTEDAAFRRISLRHKLEKTLGEDTAWNAEDNALLTALQTCRGDARVLKGWWNRYKTQHAIVTNDTVNNRLWRMSQKMRLYDLLEGLI